MSAIDIKNSKIKSSGGIIDGFTKWSVRWIPDSWVFVLVITFTVYLLALMITTRGPIELIQDYQKGFWSLLTFAMQMCLLMVTGFTVAESAPVRKAILRLIDIPKTAASTIVMFALVSGLLWWLHCKRPIPVSFR